jgi:hypothetical protein
VLALYFIFMQYIAGKFRKCEKLPEQGMYLSRSRTGNIFPYRTVVVLRHHVYVPEFHDPSCYSVDRHPNRGIDHPTVCDQYSVRICSLDVNMNNIDEKLLLYCRCLETFSL